MLKMDKEINFFSFDYHEDLSAQQMEIYYLEKEESMQKANQELIQEYLKSIDFFYE